MALFDDGHGHSITKPSWFLPSLTFVPLSEGQTPTCQDEQERRDVFNVSVNVWELSSSGLHH